MSIEISGNGRRPPPEASEAARAQAERTGANAARGPAQPTQPTASGDQLRLSDKASQLQALEAQIASLPVVDTQRVRDVQRTIATGSLQVEPARVADKVLTFEAGLAKPQ
jgi:negative regulator of flagellin synthesis FlgM